jgi:hypothetical protein
VRYYHRPQGNGDAHGYGTPSRFLTDKLQALCRVSRPGEPPSHLAASARAQQRITMSVDALFD